jgi:hypothetical protein
MTLVNKSKGKKIYTKEKFLELQRKVIPNLTKKEKKRYKKEIQNISDLGEKIEAVKDWIIHIKRRKRIKKCIQYIKTNFPEQVSYIKHRLREMKFEEEKVSFLQKKVNSLKDVEREKLDLECSELLTELKKKMNDEDFYEVRQKYRNFDYVEKKYKYLKKKIKNL